MKSSLLQSLTQDPDERITLARVLDCADAAASRAAVTHTAFLTPHERALAGQIAPGALFFGGYPSAERTVAVFLPDWADTDTLAAYADLAVIRAVRRDREDSAPTHRDYLGALLGLGIRRDMVGDLLVRPDGCDILAAASIAPFLRDNLTSAGRFPLDVTLVELCELIIPEQAFRELRDTVASMRLDGIVAAAFSLSRGKAADAVAAGKVFLNGVPCEKADREVAAGDSISLRGNGKCVLDSVGGVSRKGRICIVLKRYL
ncbi:MAG: YlmH/Sll1252 family protein [Clostridiaceae bacterium]|nr:YlmH/Sll1252 family protein [Clostridiaceae bacterium]